MEVVFRQVPCFPPSTTESRHSVKTSPNSFRPRPPNRKSGGEFSDKSHVQYYSGPRMAIKGKEEKKEMKKKLKLLKGLSKNLSTFSEMGFYLHPHPDDGGLDQQVKGQMISEATEVLLGQLEKLKEAKMESKRIKKAKKKTSLRMTECKDSSSSSSSSSSESDDNVVNMSQLKAVTVNTEAATSTESIVTENAAICKAVGGEEEECGKKIEVCMGGKCKRSGAAMLLENFNKAVGGEAEVVGCKCMGKCRDGPNVKLRTNQEEVLAASSLCIGVGLEDVDTIVANFFNRSSSPPHMLPAF